MEPIVIISILAITIIVIIAIVAIVIKITNNETKEVKKEQDLIAEAEKKIDKSVVLVSSSTTTSTSTIKRTTVTTTSTTPENWIPKGKSNYVCIFTESPDKIEYKTSNRKEMIYLRNYALSHKFEFKIVDDKFNIKADKNKYDEFKTYLLPALEQSIIVKYGSKSVEYFVSPDPGDYETYLKLLEDIHDKDPYYTPDAVTVGQTVITLKTEIPEFLTYYTKTKYVYITDDNLLIFNSENTDLHDILKLKYKLEQVIGTTSVYKLTNVTKDDALKIRKSLLTRKIKFEKTISSEQKIVKEEEFNKNDKASDDYKDFINEIEDYVEKYGIVTFESDCVKINIDSYNGDFKPDENKETYIRAVRETISTSGTRNPSNVMTYIENFKNKFLKL